MIERHYKTRELAEILSCHEETILRLAQRGQLDSIYLGGERRYPESAIRQFLERDKAASARPASGRAAHVYVVSTEHAVKVGITGQPVERRLAAIEKACGFPARLEHAWTLDDSVAFDVEQGAHWLLRDHRLRGEWFSCDAEAAVAAVESCITQGPPAGYLLGHDDGTAVEAAVSLLGRGRAM